MAIVQTAQRLASEIGSYLSAGYDRVTELYTDGNSLWVRLANGSGDITPSNPVPVSVQGAIVATVTGEGLAQETGGNLASAATSLSTLAGAVSGAKVQVVPSDGTRVATFKAASAAAAFADTAEVVDVRPGGVFPAASAPTDSDVATTTATRVGSWLMAFQSTLNSAAGGFLRITGAVLTTAVTALDTRTWAGDMAGAEDNVNNVVWGQYAALSSNKNVWTNVATSAAASGNSKNAAGRLRSIKFTNCDSTAVFAIVYNSASAPGASPTAASIFEAVEVPAGASVMLDYPEGLYLATGISWGYYTTYALGTAYSGGKTLTSVRYL